MLSHESSTKALVVAEVLILQDDHGRYNLNALHKASECADITAKEPGRWARLKSTKALIAELKSQSNDMYLDVIKGGDAPGVFAHELLAVSYAGWISPAFQLKVNQAFLDMRSGPSLPKLHNPLSKMLIETIMRLDAVEEEARQAQATAAQAKEMALQVAQAQQWVTLRQYVAMHALTTQLPPALQRRYAVYLGTYCAEHGLPVYKTTPVGVAWPVEHTYPVWTIQQTLQTWLYRDAGQRRLRDIDIAADGIHYDEEPRDA